MLLVIVVAAAALLAGLAANRYLRPLLLKGEDDRTGMSVTDLVGPLLTMAVLLLAFVLVNANGSYDKADAAARSEARALDQLVETAEYAPAAQRDRIQAAAVCYARAVRVQEWPAMADGNGSAAPSVWTAEFRQTFSQLQDQPFFELLAGADDKRSEARDERLTEAGSTIPSAVLWFLLATLAVTVVGLGICLPRRDNLGQVVTLTVITAVLATTLVLIRDVDRPFGGIVDIKPTAIADVERQAERDFLADAPGGQLPCDERGDRRTV
ncbi:bestrophin-like domain [Kitasatospora sp. NPDC004272]